MNSYKKEKPPAFIAAEAYHAYARKYKVYTQSSRRLVELYSSYKKKLPASVLDLACGTGVSLAAIEESFSASKIMACDSSSEMLEIAKGEHGGVEFIQAKVEDLGKLGLSEIDVVFCNAAFWYFDRDLALKSIHSICSGSAYLLFNLSQPAIDLEDGQYDDRFLQTMVEVLDDRGLVFHREDGYGAGKLKLSYKPPSVADIVASLVDNGFRLVTTRTWRFSKSLSELKDFYSLPGFGVKMFRELTDQELKNSILDEIVSRLHSQGVENINFRWQEFAAKKG